MIRKSRMVLAAPGPLLTPPPSSSPPKTPYRSYSAQTVAASAVAATRKTVLQSITKPQLIYVQN